MSLVRYRSIVQNALRIKVRIQRTVPMTNQTGIPSLLQFPQENFVTF